MQVSVETSPLFAMETPSLTDVKDDTLVFRRDTDKAGKRAFPSNVHLRVNSPWVVKWTAIKLACNSKF